MSVTSIPDPASYGYPSLVTSSFLNPPSGFRSPTGTASATTGAAVAGTPATSKYQTELQTLNQQDTAELLYASFLSPADSQANGTAVLEQAAQLLGPPGTTAASAPGTTASKTGGAATIATSTDPATLPTVSDLLGQSDSAANAAIGKYVNAPAGSSILDYQA